MVCTPQVNSLCSIVMTPSSCVPLSSLVSLPQKLRNWKNPMFKKFSPSGTCCLCCLCCIMGYHNDTDHPLELSAQHFEPCQSIGLACSLKHIKRGANSVHVPSTCNVHTRSFYIRVMKLLPRYANVPSLVSPAQKFINSEDPMFKIFPSLARAACAGYHWVPK